ncbi:TetR family transcriptional regulator [Rhodococcus sp. 1163]|uniref:TetR/AcrR family transcriptional regulator n=1 Tax=unclassified Rhodococcus (in: high G+C Gram-positive bacteria) TaxID=192944 RepID=UPI0009FBE08E|nr:TetR/AcrR family transcriptional regulator [Rhodococcus sp. 1163]ORI20034.1 TetR family transcriptional regulator [Rhodococcus sp. 1163]
MAEQLTQILRTDASANRDRILEVAREVFAAEGLGVSMREVARRAEVGPATLYRRFPTKKDLILEAFLDEFRICRDIVRTGCANPDAWQGFCSVIDHISELNAQNQGFTEAFIAEYPDAVDLESHRGETLRAFADLALRAKQQGELRQDFVVDDFVLILMANRGLSTAPPEVRTRAARRFAAMMTDALHASPANRTLPPPPSLARTAVFGR